MFRTFCRLSLLTVVGIPIAFTSIPNVANAGSFAPTGTATIAASPTSLNAGGTSTFTVTFSCASSWTTATAQLFDGPSANGKPLGSSFQLSVPNGQVNSMSASHPRGLPPIVTATKTITFPTAGTFNVYVSISDVRNIYVDSSSSTIDSPLTTCDTQDAASTTVSVNSVATTTIAPSVTSSTIASTSTSMRTLPKTGSDSTNALVALAAAIAGGAIILGRRRLAK